MWDGIKPTRLYRLTGIVHNRNMVQARLNANMDRCYAPRPREYLFNFIGVILASATGAAYAFGIFSKPYDCSQEEIESEMTCPSDPCPPEAPPPKPKTCPRKTTK
ncbi:hypothetical protein SFRURICE_008422 [Spodoptera frugiperda]|nr:hypothetical protein SFRURICE_008422 [Spodoptera frugiperda]